MNILKVTCFPRIHITLIGLNDNGYRVNGGIGFSINEPKLYISIKEAKAFAFIDKRKNSIDATSLLKLEEVVLEVVNKERFTTNIQVEINGDAFTHYGLGVGTNLTLACLEGLFILNKKKYTPEKLIKLSRRGGTSGIGVNTYFRGGFVFDIGRKRSTDRTEFKPSDLYSNVQELPLVVTQVSMPSWQIGICIPDLPNISVSDEKEFFKRTCPIPEKEVFQSLYESLYGVLGAVLEKDVEIFAKSVSKIQSCYWKATERDLYGDQLYSFEEKLKELGAKAVGMSSLGPTLFFIAEEPERIVRQIKKESPNTKAFTVTPSNVGRVIEYG